MSNTWTSGYFSFKRENIFFTLNSVINVVVQYNHIVCSLMYTNNPQSLFNIQIPEKYILTEDGRQFYSMIVKHGVIFLNIFRKRKSRANGKI